MGLDMYLRKHIYVGGNYNKAKGGLNIEYEKKPWHLKSKTLKIPAEQISEVVVPVAYWRKANAIHDWFVRNCQDGRDECQLTLVDQDQLRKLRSLCKEALKTRVVPDELQPKAGFFFGSTEIGDWYWEDLKITVDQLKRIENSVDYYYQSSW